MSWLYCCFKSFSICGFRDCMINSAAFQPPKDQRYELKFDREDPIKGTTHKLILKDFDGKRYQPSDFPGLRSSVVLLETKTFAQIPAVFIENENCKSNFVILYSHGNSTDLGRMFRTLQELSQALNVHVFAYEYRGYGPTKGKVGEMELIFGIIAAYEYLTRRLDFKWTNIILYGRSIGSGPTIYLASHPDYPVCGIILHSPIASGFRIFDFDFKKTDKTDLFPNCDFIKHVRAHIFLIHGEADIDVTIAHGKLLAAQCQNPFNPWWVEDGDHNNIDYNFRKSYYLRLGKFLRYVRDFNLDKPMEELQEFYNVEPWWGELNHIYFQRISKIEKAYEKTMEKTKKKERKKTIKILTQSVLLTSSPSFNDRLLDSSHESSSESYIARNSIKGESFRGPEVQAFVPRSLRSRVASVIQSKSKYQEIEFGPSSVGSKAREQDEDEEFDKEFSHPDNKLIEKLGSGSDKKIESEGTPKSTKTPKTSGGSTKNSLRHMI